MHERPNDQLPPYGTIVFDCDSTLSAIEGIDELAGDLRDEVALLTSRAMDGGAPLEEVYGARLERIQPTRTQLEAVGAHYIEAVLPNARALIAALTRLGKRVAIVSGGLRPAVLTLAEHLGVPAERVHAVDIRFDEAGNYAGFDQDSPLARSGGKVEVLRAIAAERGARAVCLIGDGVTDLEAASEVARFIAFGGVERRAAVFDAAAVTCEHADLAALLPHLLLPAELVMLRIRGGGAPLLAAAAPYL